MTDKVLENPMVDEDLVVKRRSSVDGMHTVAIFDGATGLTTINEGMTLQGQLTYVTGQVTAAARTVALDNITQEVTETITLDGTDETNKYVILSYAPKVKANTYLCPKVGIPQIYGTDFVVTSDNGDKRLSWSTLGLDGILVSGDIIVVKYLING